MRREGDVAGLEGLIVGAHLVAKCRVHESLDLRHAPVAGRQLHMTSTVSLKLGADVPIRRDVGASEPVDGLFRVSDDEQLSSERRDTAGIGVARIVGGQQQQDIGLDRIGILKFVNKDSRIPSLQMRTNRLIAGNQAPGSHQKVYEVQTPGGVKRYELVDVRYE